MLVEKHLEKIYRAATGSNMVPFVHILQASIENNSGNLSFQKIQAVSSPNFWNVTYYEARVRFGTRVRVWVWVCVRQDSVIKKLLKIFLFIFSIYFDY